MKGGGTETKFALYEGDKYRGVFATRDEAIAAAKRPKTEQKPGKSDWTEIGKNAIGQTIYEDQRGVRSYIENGIRHTEPVGIIPGGGISVRGDRGEEWTLAEGTPAPATPEKPATLADAFAQHFAKGESFPTIVQARKFARDAGFGEDPKQIEEAIELAMVRTARKIAKKPDAFKQLVALYERQPRLGTRTSTQMRDQAFSTPVPLAYVASRLAGIGPQSTVYEPTAGNGALLIEANPTRTIANEINPERAAALRSQGFKVVKQYDAAEDGPGTMAKFDRVIANPPFGPVKEGQQSKIFDLGYVQHGYRTREIDHAIALRALEEMEPNGRAALIVGGLPKTAVSEEARSDGYNSKSKREFYKTLYDHYRVTDHFTVAGELYERQGAGWPVDVIVIEGRGKSDLPLPAVSPPRILKTWDELGGLLNAYRPGSIAEVGEPAPASADHGAAGSNGGVREAGERLPEFEPEPREPGAVQPGPAERLGYAEAGGEQQPERNEPAVRGEPAGPGAAPAAERRAPRVETETEKQVAYKPKSLKTDGLGTLVPINMRTSIDNSLDAVREKQGDIDAFVASELGYEPDELGRYFASEQVDALALAIDNIKRGKGFIIGDQTGIGKGRVNAAIIRWALKNKRIPIFVTEKPNLYGDMYRDLGDIGIQDFLSREPRILVTNAGLRMPLDESGKAKIATAEPAVHNRLLDSLTGANFGEKFDMIFTNYSQMQTVKQGDTPRRRFLANIAPGSVVIFDESHNAGGQSAPLPGQPANRAGFARDLVRSANGAFYSSATYAKRPDVMDLYAATDMSMAVDDPKELGAAIQRGGVPMQQVVASMLAKAGQYIRRERSFAGITYDTPTIPVSRDVYDGNLALARRHPAIQRVRERRHQGPRQAIESRREAGQRRQRDRRCRRTKHDVFVHHAQHRQSDVAGDEGEASSTDGDRSAQTRRKAGAHRREHDGDVPDGLRGAGRAGPRTAAQRHIPRRPAQISGTHAHDHHQKAV